MLFNDYKSGFSKNYNYIFNHFILMEDFDKTCLYFVLKKKHE